MTIELTTLEKIKDVISALKDAADELDASRMDFEQAIEDHKAFVAERNIAMTEDRLNTIQFCRDCVRDLENEIGMIEDALYSLRDFENEKT